MSVGLKKTFVSRIFSFWNLGPLKTVTSRKSMDWSLIVGFNLIVALWLFSMWRNWSNSCNVCSQIIKISSKNLR